MLDNSKIYLFLAATILLNITPGIDMMFVTSSSLSKGVKAGIFSAIGIGLGCIFHILLAVVGLSAIISRSILIYEIIKYLGVGYLVYMGLKLILQKNIIHFTNVEKGNNDYKHINILKQGIQTNVLNPKVAIFFLAFLPQFVDASISSIELQLFLLGLLFTISGTIVNIIVAIAIGSIAKKLILFPKFWKYQEKISGSILVIIGIRLALLKRT